MMHYRLAGRSMVAYSMFTLATTIVGTFLLDALIVDVGAILVFFLGRSVAGGSRRAARWSVALMGYYLVLSASMLAFSQFSPDRIRIGGRAITPSELPATTWALAAAALGAGVCLALLIRALRYGNGPTTT